MKPFVHFLFVNRKMCYDHGVDSCEMICPQSVIDSRNLFVPDFARRFLLVVHKFMPDAPSVSLHLVYPGRGTYAP